MVNRSKTPRSLGEGDTGPSKEKDIDQVYCVVLHVVEAINFIGRDGERESIVMNAALNTVDFEVEGTPSATAETIIFNSNCIWECDMAGIKRIKTDHRPVKLTFFACSKHLQRKPIGTVLLPVRGLPVLTTTSNNNPVQLKMIWHKLICTSTEYRSHKPEVLLMLAIIKKSILHAKDFEPLLQVSHIKQPAPSPIVKSPGHSITASMLQSQANVYVQSLVQLGLLQVGNDPLIDCDIIEVKLQFKKLKNLSKLLKSLSQGKEPATSINLVFDFVGNVTSIELKTNDSDAYMLSDELGLRFKSSLQSMRLYFQRIFYLPINMYVNGAAIANYRMDFGKLLPADSYFLENRKFVRNGCLTFNRFGRMDSSRDIKPQLEYSFSVELKAIYSRPNDGPEESVQYQPEAPFVLTKEQQQQSSESNQPKPDNVSFKENEVLPLIEVQNSGNPVCVGRDFRRRKKLSSQIQNEFGLDTEEGLVRKSIETKKICNSLFQYSSESNAECLAIYKNQQFDNDKSNKEQESSQGTNEESMADGKENVKALNNVETNESNSMEKPQVPPKRAKMNSKSASKAEEMVAVEQTASMEQLTKLLGQEVEKLTKSVEIIENRSQQDLRIARKMEIEEDDFESDSTLCSFRPQKHQRKSSKTELPASQHSSATSISHKHSKERKKGRRYSGQKRYVQQIIDETETSMEHGSLPRDCPASSTYRVKVKHSDLDVSECDLFKVHHGKRKSKSDEQLSKAPAANSLKVFAKPKSANTRDKISTTELSLRARWVEVNKEQAKALDETAKFIQQTCQNEIRKVQQEDQQALGQPQLVESKRNIRKVRSRKLRIQREVYSDSDSDSDNLHAENAKKKYVESAENSVSIVGSESSVHVISSQSSDQRIERIIKKMKVSKTTIQEEKYEPETSNDLPDKLLKKKSSRKIPNEASVESSEQLEESVQAQPKKKVHRKRSKPGIQQPSEDDLTSMGTLVELKSSNNALRQSSSRKSLERTSYMSALDQFCNPNSVSEKVKAWRQHQIQLFEEELARKEQQYKKDLEQMEDQDGTLVRSQGVSHKGTIIDYEAKFKELELHINQLQREIDEQVRLFANRSQEMRQENKQLEREKLMLKERIFHMEMQIHELRGKAKAPDDRDLNHILKEMRSQNERFMELSKEKDRYKKQWRRSAKEVNELKRALIKENDPKESLISSEFPFNLREILTKNEEEFEREFGKLRYANGSPSFLVKSFD
ncbi:interaptin [Drosophila subobscura]|uniref:interaptin n=1 Tax=Drosophila subobscura TaxID=7241 RepID=UPI00155AFA1B|nr:interaptin [Drosophila subobscura]